MLSLVTKGLSGGNQLLPAQQRMPEHRAGDMPRSLEYLSQVSIPVEGKCSQLWSQACHHTESSGELNREVVALSCFRAGTCSIARAWSGLSSGKSTLVWPNCDPPCLTLHMLSAGGQEALLKSSALKSLCELCLHSAYLCGSLLTQSPSGDTLHFSPALPRLSGTFPETALPGTQATAGLGTGAKCAPVPCRVPHAKGASSLSVCLSARVT